MPRVVPSQVTEHIDQAFPPVGLAGGHNRGRDSSQQLAALLALAEKIPDELLLLEGKEYSNYVTALEIIRRTLSEWLQSPVEVQLPMLRGTHPVLLIYEALKHCPDEAPSPATAALTFITDPNLRDSIRLDISAANHGLVNREWKGATVLAGSAAEALLLWAIQEKEQLSPGSLRAAVAALVTTNRPTDASPESWGLSALIEVARQMSLINEDTAVQNRLCKNFRNLIHPGRAARLAQVCDRGTALAALAAVELVVRDLTAES
jgi:hypothetical protein